jgi:acyl-CoA thioester hydrolase
MSDLAPPSGVIRGGIHHLPVRVYYEDTDFSGIVYHAGYLRFLERGRSDALRCAGIDHISLSVRDEPLALAVRRLNIEFLKPAHIDDALVVRTSYSDVVGARILARQGIFRGEEQLIEAQVEAVCIARSGRPRRFPVELVAALKSHLAVGE